MSHFYAYEPFYDLEPLWANSLGPLSAKNQVQHRAQSNTDGAHRSTTNTVTATFPGLINEDVHIDVHNNRLSITGESKISSDREEDGYAIRERRFGKPSRILQLPFGVKDDEIKVKMDDGSPKPGPNWGQRESPLPRGRTENIDASYMYQYLPSDGARHRIIVALENAM